MVLPNSWMVDFKTKNHEKSHLEMDDDWRYPHDLGQPPTEKQPDLGYLRIHHHQWGLRWIEVMI